MKEYLTSIRTGATVERDYIPSPNELPPTPEEAAAIGGRDHAPARD
jgi:hypothetical protein